MNFKIKFAKISIKVLKLFQIFAINFEYVLNFCNKIFKIFLIFFQFLLKLFHLNIVELNAFDI